MILHEDQYAKHETLQEVMIVRKKKIMSAAERKWKERLIKKSECKGVLPPSKKKSNVRNRKKMKGTFDKERWVERCSSTEKEKIDWLWKTSKVVIKKER